MNINTAIFKKYSPHIFFIYFYILMMSALYQTMYWGAFDINILVFIDLVDVFKNFIFLTIVATGLLIFIAAILSIAVFPVHKERDDSHKRMAFFLKQHFVVCVVAAISAFGIILSAFIKIDILLIITLFTGALGCLVGEWFSITNKSVSYKPLRLIIYFVFCSTPFFLHELTVVKYKNIVSGNSYRYLE